ncbi:MAG: hypothetical protein ACKVVP_20650 [Chloroflexota bacterium]
MDQKAGGWAHDDNRVGVYISILAVILGMVSRFLEPASFGDFDETIYAQTLFLWLRGVPPYIETFYSQGPLFLAMLAPFALVIGPSLDAIQVGVTFWGTLGLAATAVLGYRIGGGWGAAVSATVMATSPLLTHLDSHVLAEGPAVALAALSLAIGLRMPPTRSTSLVAGALFGASLATKSLLPTLAIPLIGHTVSAQAGRSSTIGQLLGLGLGSAFVMFIAILPFDLGSIWDQLVRYRLEARDASAASPTAFTRAITRGLTDDLGGIMAASVGALCLIRYAWKSALILGIWLLATVVLLALHQPLFPRHSSALLLPLALLAAGIGLLKPPAFQRHLTPIVAVTAIGLAITLSIPAHVKRWTEIEGSGEIAEAARALQATTTESEYVLTDLPAIAIMANRVIVPSLVDLSQVRLSSGRVNTVIAQRETERYEPAAILFWFGRLDSGPLEAYPATLRDRYTRVWQNRPGQSLWIREDAEQFDPAGIPDFRALTQTRFGNGLMVRGVSFSGQVRAGDTWRLRVLWELTDTPPDIDRIELSLVLSEGTPIAAQSVPFSPDKVITAWPDGARRMVQYEISVPTTAAVARVTPRLSLTSQDGADTAVSSPRQRERMAYLELPPIQVSRGNQLGR